MLNLLLSLAFLGTCQSSDPGFVFSRSVSDLQSYITSITPSILSNLMFSDPEPLILNTRDGLVSVVVNITNLIFKDVNISTSGVSVAVSAPDWVNVTLTSLSCNLYYNYTEVGFATNKAGSGISSAYNSKMTMNLGLFYSGGKLNLQVLESNFTVVVASMITVSNTMSNSLNTAVNNFLSQYLNDIRFAALIPGQLTTYLNNYLDQSQYQINIPSSKLYMDSHILYPGINVTNTYVSYSINGTIVAQNNSVPVHYTPPQDLPIRVPTSTPSESQIIVSQYTLFTYFSAFMQQNPVNTLASLPSGYPNFLSTNNGYFPELLAALGNTNLALNISMTQVPYIFMLNTGMLLRTSISFTIYANSTGKNVTCTSFNVVVDYQCKVFLNNGELIGDCVKPKIVTLTQFNANYPVSSYNLQRFAFDLIQTVFLIGNTKFFFPVIPMNYPQNTIFTSFKTTYYTDYFAVEYLAQYH